MQKTSKEGSNIAISPFISVLKIALNLWHLCFSEHLILWLLLLLMMMIFFLATGWKLMATLPKYSNIITYEHTINWLYGRNISFENRPLYRLIVNKEAKFSTLCQRPSYKKQLNSRNATLASSFHTNLGSADAKSREETGFRKTQLSQAWVTLHRIRWMGTSSSCCSLVTWHRAGMALMAEQEPEFKSPPLLWNLNVALTPAILLPHPTCIIPSSAMCVLPHRAALRKPGITIQLENALWL